MHRWWIALALFVSLAPAAFAGGIHARIEGPGHDGLYAVRTYSCDKDAKLDPYAIAEGMVGGKRRSVLIRLEPTTRHGVYLFPRTWPQEGRWMIRLSLGHPPAPATVATLRADGKVVDNQLFFNSDGARECQRVLNPNRNPNDPC
jgi:hypothetical protein